MYIIDGRGLYEEYNDFDQKARLEYFQSKHSFNINTCYKS